MIGRNNRKGPSQICEKLYLGSQLDAQNKAILKNLDIKYILVVGKNLTLNFPEVTYLNNFPPLVF
jgi:hypothetical protein